MEPDLGDAWAYYLRFELQHGSEEEQRQVVQRCVAAEPRHGPEWCRVSKDVKNWRLKTEQVLRLAAKQLPVPV